MSHAASPQNLRSPRESWTATSAVIIWDKPDRTEKVASYDIHINGRKIQNTEELCFKLNKLEPDTSYAVSLTSIDVSGRISETSPEITVQTSQVGVLIDVTEAPYLVEGNGKTLVTAAIQKAINDCPRGGTVYIPGGTYITAGLFLKSNMTLQVDGELVGSLDLDDYPLVTCRFGKFSQFYASMINIGSATGDIVENVKLVGHGKINGNGEKLRPEFAIHAPNTSYNQRNSTFTTLRAKGIYVDGVTFENSACWSVHPVLSDDITFYDITLNNIDYDLVNGDGVNPDACRQVNILKSLICSQDDNISIKSGNRDDSFPDQRACEDILVSDCTLKGGFGISPGLESYYGVRRVTIRNCKFEQTASIFHPICIRAGFASRTDPAAGGVIEDITVSGIQYFNDQHKDNMWIRGPIDFDMFYMAGPLDTPDYDHPAPIDDKTPVMRNILLEDIVIVDHSDRYGITLLGRPETKISNVVLRNIQCLSRYGMTIANVDQVVLENVSIDATSGEPSTFRHCLGLDIRPNLIKNPGFESGKADWEFFDARIVDDSNPFTDFHHRCNGRRTLKLYTVHSKSAQKVSLANMDARTLVLTATGKVLHAGVTGKVAVHAIDVDGKVLADFAEELTFTELSYLTKDVQMTIPQNAAALQIEARTDGLAFYVDDLGLFAAPRISGTAFNGDAPCFVYSDGFTQKQGFRQSCYGDIHEAVGPDETITLTFTGNRARLFGNKGPEAGAIALTLDDTTLTPITLHADTEQPSQLWFDTGVLQNGDHTILLTTAASPASPTTCKTGFDYAYVVSNK